MNEKEVQSGEDKIQSSEDWFESVEKDLLNLKNVILKQNEVIKQIAEKVIELKEEILAPKTSFFYSSIGNEGVKQTNKQLNNQTLNSDLNTKIVEKPVLDLNFKHFQENINKLFGNISKQELKTFLTIYQLEEEKVESSYVEIARKMALSETCIRVYVNNLVKKGIPLRKARINNKKSLFFIDPDFKNMNLKNKLISFYYSDDPIQSTLFDLKTKNNEKNYS